MARDNAAQYRNRVDVNLDDDTYLDLRSLARTLDRSISATARLIIRDCLGKRGSVDLLAPGADILEVRGSKSEIRGGDDAGA